ncbi:MAG: aminotransferase class I/II-fold pyridoxal phosphate-dependent enzyme [Clostridiales Family XIII bacterium]|jgi:histidinol-phosphate aminotransferase|nr:aminotransferase class I/II-fold pyridoxal phosphate-dependent enzyme [Clostridiales Family XIII bacterium]
MRDGKGSFICGLYGGEPYASGEQPESGIVKLNTNENPYPPAPGVLKALADFDGRRLRLYPKQDGGVLREALAAYHGIAKENVFVGNGSDEVLALAFRACFGFGEGRPVLFADVTYSFYPVWCKFFGIPFETLPVGDDFHPRADSFARQNGGIVVCDPGAPTGLAEGEAFLDGVLAANGGASVVIVDEAYADFADFSAISRAVAAPNLLVTRTFSKSRSLAGLRVGYAVGDTRLIAALTAAKDSFNSYPVSVVTAVAGAAALEDEAYYQAVVGKIKETRDSAARRLRTLGFDVPESSSNFLFAGCGSAVRAKAIFEQLKANGVYVRYFDKPRICDRLRISIGKPEEMDVLFARLEGYLAL